MTRDIIALVTALLILVAAAAFAQTDPAPVPDPNAGAFDALSPGNQKIAQALFDAQQQPAPGTTPSSTPTTPTTRVYTRDEIAALKQTQGWGQVFKTMQAEGQLEGAKNLGQVVSGKYQAPASPTPGTEPAPSTTTGGGATQGAFAQLSPGNRKIAQALFDAQQQPAPGTTPSSTPTAPATPATKVYTRDEIAALKQTQGWGQVFKTMQADGQLEGAKNLGQVVSGKYQPPAPAPTTTPSTQTGGSTGPTTPQGTEGAFARLSPGNRKIAQALFDAQQQPAPGTTPSTTTTAPATTKVYTRDEIAALKQTQGWGQVFKTMQAEGQLQGAKNLGHIVSTKYQAPTTITTASGRTEVVGTGFSGGSNHVALQKHGGTEVGGSGASKGSGHGGSSTVSRGSSGHGRVAHGKPDVPGAKAHGQGRTK